MGERENVPVMGEPAGDCGVGLLRGDGRGGGGGGHGGKDSLWMEAKVGEEVVKAPGTLVVSVYAGCPDISLTVTPGIKHVGRSSLGFVDLSGGHARLGGSALAQTFKQLGDASPDCDTALLKRAFLATQRLLRERVLLAGHDRSDGGLLTTVLEMCFGGDCGCVMEATTENSVMEFLFNEELGLVVEVDDACDREDANGEPREGEREGRGGGGRGREGFARPVGGDAVRAGQATVEPRVRQARAGGSEEAPQARVEADLRAARHAGGVAGERVEVPRGDHPRGGLEGGCDSESGGLRAVGRVHARPAERAHHAAWHGGLPRHCVPGRVQLRGRAGVGARVEGVVGTCAVQQVLLLCVRLHLTTDICDSCNHQVCEKQRRACTVMREYLLQQSDFNGSITVLTWERMSQFGRVCVIT